MTQPINSQQLGEYMSRHFADVFSTMLSLSAVLSQSKARPAFVAQVSSAVGFAGESVVGALNVHLSEALARRSATILLGLSAEHVPRPAEVNVALGKLSDLLAGGLTTWLCNAGAACVMGTPAIIRGKAFTIERMPDLDHTALVFECGCEYVIVEMHVRLHRI
jgi:CheY-specific phosphatase CheX